MAVNLASCLLKDFVYQQDKDMKYIMKEGIFELVDRDEVADAILENLDKISSVYLGDDKKYSIERVYDPFALNQALCRYSRDIFGERRLRARLNYIGRKYALEDKEMRELLKYEDYGLKVNSESPYLHRRLACLLYWLSILKPFRVILKSSVSENENMYIYLEHHNEWMSYLLVMMILKCVNHRINVHENKHIFRQFLYDLHYRNLSRSALEFFLNEHIHPIN